ncbi:MAG: peptide chain release factor N(5)-glutamine methyltransferase [Bacteroidota bacterium]
MDQHTNSKELFKYMVSCITLKESQGEIESIVYLVMHSIFGLRREHIIAEKQVTYDDVELNDIIKRINSYEPIQYILQEAEFYGRLFYVSKDVLIPRPETELLVEEVIRHAKNTAVRIVDLGTGSGCIAVTLACELPNASVMATDISSAAIDIAHKNSLTFNTYVEFFLSDVLTDEIPEADIIVSNPPYITKEEMTSMNKNVVGYEPHLALFVDDNDPLIFYKSIAGKKAKAVFVEINERFGAEVKSIFIANGYKAEIIKDIDNKDRIVKAIYE